MIHLENEYVQCRERLDITNLNLYPGCMRIAVVSEDIQDLECLKNGSKRILRLRGMQCRVLVKKVKKTSVPDKTHIN